ncbi:MAG: hypothetical protein ACJ76I_15775 [Gaiellaceae bacterium]
MAWEERLFLTGGSESVLARYFCISMKAWLAKGEDGESVELRQVFGGAGMVALTPTRVVGMLSLGVWAEGPLGQDDAVVFSFPLIEVAQLRLQRARKLMGLKEVGVAVIAPAGALVLDLDRQVSEDRVARRLRRSDVMRMVLGQTVDRLADAGRAPRNELEDAAREPWTDNGEDLVVTFPHDPGPVSRAFVEED